MLRFHWPLFVLLFATISCTPKKPEQPIQTALSNTAHKVILPLVHQFESAALNLQDATERFCQNPNNPGELATARSALKQLDQQWRHLHVIQFGPAETHQWQRRIECLQPLPNSTPQYTDNKNTAATKLTSNAPLLPLIQQLLYPSIEPEDAFKVPLRCDNLLNATLQMVQASRSYSLSWHAEKGNYLGEFLTPHKHWATLQNLQHTLIAATAADTCEAPFLLELETGEQLYRHAFAPLVQQKRNSPVYQAFEQCQTQKRAECLIQLKQALIAATGPLVKKPQKAAHELN